MRAMRCDAIRRAPAIERRPTDAGAGDVCGLIAGLARGAVGWGLPRAG